MIDNSIHQSEESDEFSQRKSQLLCAEIEAQFNGWSSHEFGADVFDQSQKEESKNQKKSLENLPEEENWTTIGNEENVGEKPDQTLGLNSVLSDPKTIDLAEDTMFSKDTGNTSKATQLNSELTNQSYSSFLLTKQTVYEVHHKNYLQLFREVEHTFLGAITELEEIYLKIFKAKYEKERMYASMEIGKFIEKKQYKNQEIMVTVYINCKSIVNEIQRKNIEDCQRKQEFADKIEGIYENIKKVFSQISMVLKNKSQIIEALTKNLYEIYKEIQLLMLQKDKPNKHYHNSYLISRYLAMSQKTYFDVLKKFAKEVLSFIDILCRQIQPKLPVTLKQILISYVDIVMEYSPQSKQIYQQPFLSLAQISSFHLIYDQIVEKLLECLPKPLFKLMKDKQGISSFEYLEYMFEKLSMDVESLIFLPCIEIDKENWIYSSEEQIEVSWIPRNPQESYKIIQINLILTRQGYMIMERRQQKEEKEDYIVDFKLSTIKLKKKQNRILLMNKEKNVIDMILNADSTLGQLVFGDVLCPNSKKGELIDLFIGKAKQILKEKKSRKVL